MARRFAVTHSTTAVSQSVGADPVNSSHCYRFESVPANSISFTKQSSKQSKEEFSWHAFREELPWKLTCDANQCAS